MEKEIVEKLVKESNTIHQVLTKMNKNTSSAAYKSFKRYVTINDIDTSHFWTHKEVIENQFRNGKLVKVENDDMFVENSSSSRHSIKQRIISEELIKYECIFCGNKGEWMGKKISLILDHINGFNNDNRLDNLRFVCPNCNSTLDTHCKGHKGYEFVQKQREKENKIKEYEYKPRIDSRKVERPDVETLKQQIEEFGFVGTGKIYGVSDNSIRKWLKWSLGVTNSI